jgi:hypothetical protein
MSELKPSVIRFEQHYHDNSGVQFGVALRHNEITFKHCGEVDFPVEELDWLIGCLQYIKINTTTPKEG